MAKPWETRQDFLGRIKPDILFVILSVFLYFQVFFNIDKYLGGFPRFFEIWLSICDFVKYLIWGGQ